MTAHLFILKNTTVSVSIMFGISEKRIHSEREFAALDRNFLSWLRTSVSLLAFGLGVEKFGIFIEGLVSVYPTVFSEIAYKCNRGIYSQREGIAIMLIGAAVGLLGFVQYLIRLKQMENKIYTSTHISGIMITLFVILTGFLFLLNLGRLL
ncbi:MAG: DUF202 domain-containing protein [Nitrospirota bacterium]